MSSTRLQEICVAGMVSAVLALALYEKTRKYDETIPIAAPKYISVQKKISAFYNWDNVEWDSFLSSMGVNAGYYSDGLGLICSESLEYQDCRGDSSTKHMFNEFAHLKYPTLDKVVTLKTPAKVELVKREGHWLRVIPTGYKCTNVTIRDDTDKGKVKTFELPVGDYTRIQEKPDAKKSDKRRR